VTFIVQSGRADEPTRVFIDDHLHKGCAVEQLIIADDWKRARAVYEEEQFPWLD
jgi:hypothetical protein